MSDKTPRAYIVRCPDEDCHGQSIVYAESNAKARQMGNGDFCDCEYIDLRAKLAPEFGQYYPDGPTLRQCVEDHGWFAFCTMCELVTWAKDVAEWTERGPLCRTCKEKSR